ncbi:MAG: hypothetical protein ACR2J6_02435 [Thermoleophilaceae bacterium]
MSELADSDDEALSGEIVPEGEPIAEVRHLPVLAGPPAGGAVDVRRPASVPETVVAAIGGFVLGVAAFVLIKVLRRPRAGRTLATRRARRLSRQRGVDVQTTKSLVIDVHLLKR